MSCYIDICFNIEASGYTVGGIVYAARTVGKVPTLLKEIQAASLKPSQRCDSWTKPRTHWQQPACDVHDPRGTLEITERFFFVQ